MANEKFSIPKHFNILQALELFYSIVANQYDNINEDLKKRSKPYDYRVIEKIYRRLDLLLDYLNHGLHKIERKFGITNGLSQWVEQNQDYKEIFEEFQILGNDIRTLRRKSVLIMNNDTNDSSKFLFWKPKNKIQIKESDEMEDKIIMQRVKHIKEIRRQEELKRAAEQKIIRQRNEMERKELETQREKLLELRIKEQLETKMNKTLEDEKYKRRQVELSNEKKLNELKNEIAKGKKELQNNKKKIIPPVANNITNVNSNVKNKTRRSLDLPRKSPSTDMSSNTTVPPLRKSLNSRPGRKVENRQSLDMNRAAVLAWSASQKATSSAEATNRPQSQIYTSMKNENNSRKETTNDRSDVKRTVKRKSSIKSPQMKSVPNFDSEMNIPPIRRGKSVSRIDTSKTGPKSKSVPATPNTGHNPLEPTKSHSRESSPLDSRLKHIMETLQGVDVTACQQIINDIMVSKSHIYWDDIAGLQKAKNSLKEAVVYPFLRPDLFKGLREPIRGMLLFGPPGTGKTMIAKAIATESKSTFFSISASSLLSKYLGESEKLVRALFYLAKRMAPSIIFIDEIDSLLGDRSDNANESSRRIKTELLIQWSELSSATAREDKNNTSALDNRVLVLSATNLPWIIDEAARRRFTRRLYITLPDSETRLYHLKKLMSRQKNSLSEEDFNKIASMIDGYSGSDITALAKEAAMEPIRDLGDDLMNINFENVRPVELSDFLQAMATVKMSVSQESLKRYEEWADLYGSTGS